MSDQQKPKNESLWIRLESQFASRPILVIMISLVLTFIFAYFLATRTRIDNDVSTMIPKTNPVKLFDDESSHIFGQSGGMIIALENPQGILNADTLKIIKNLSSRLEIIDTEIQREKIGAFLKGFNVQEKQNFLDFLNEKSFDLKSVEDLSALLKDESELSFSFPDTELMKKVSALKNDSNKLSQIYSTFFRFTDEKNQWQKRVRKVTSLSDVDAVFSEFTQPEKLSAFFSKNRISPEKGISFSSYLMEKSLTDLEALSSFIQSKPFDRIAVFFEFSKEDLDQIRAWKKENLTELISLIQLSQKQIKVTNLINWDEMEKNPEKQIFWISERLRNWDLYKDALYAEKNPNVTLISLEMVPQLLKEERETLIVFAEKAVQEALKGTSMRYYLAGEPVITSLMGQYMVRDLKVLFPIVLVIMGGFLYLSFRHWRGVALPMITVVFSTIWTLGTIALMGKAISIVSTVLPVLLVAVGSAYGIHIIHHYYEDRALGMDRETALRRTIKEIGIAVIMAGATTIAGFGSLATNSVIPLKDFGIFAAIGVSYALIISMIFIPALLRVGKLPKKIASLHLESEEELEHAHGRLGSFLEKLGNSTLKHKKLYLLIFALLLAGSLIGTWLLKVEINSINYFKESTPIKQADHFIQSNFAGTSTLNIVIDTGKTNGVLDFEFLEKVEKLQTEIEKDPLVGKATSVVDFIKKMNQTMNYGSRVFYSIPQEVFDSEGKIKQLATLEEKKAALSAVILSYIDQFSREDTRQLVNSDKSMVKVAIVLKTGSTIVTQDLTQKVNLLVKNTFSEKEKIRYSGVNPLYLEVNSLIVDGQMWSIFSSALMVLLLVALMLRSPLMGVVSILPLGLAILINFGLMGLLDIHLDVSTAIVSNIAIGIGVDYTIHFLNGYLILLKKGEGRQVATVHTAVRSGQAILINAVSVAAGFLVLCFSSFMPLINVGWLIALTMITTSFSALTLVPVILNYLKMKKWILNSAEK